MLDNNIDNEIKKRLQKDELISKRAEDVFKNFFEEGKDMDEKLNQNEEIHTNEPKNEPKKFYKWKKPVAAAACLAILLGGGNIYASTQGYGNVFFMIKYLVTGEKTEITDKNEILSDRDIAISYEPINIAKGLTLTVKKLQIKDNEARLFVVSGEKEVLDSSFVPLKFIVCNQDGKLLCNQISARDEQNSGYVTDELVLKDFKDTDKKLVLEVYKANLSKLANIIINIDERKVEVDGEQEALTKISEIELKEFLGFAAGLSQESTDTENEIKVDLACRMISTKHPESSQYIIIDNSIAYPTEEVDKMIESFTGETIKDFKDGKFIKVIVKDGKKYYTYVSPSDMSYGGECINISSISYCNGLYTVKYTYFYRGGEPDEDINMDNYDIYEQEICISLNDNSNYSKFKVVSKEKPIIIKNVNHNNNQSGSYSNANLTCEEAETILNDKFQSLENLYFRTALYFKREDIETERGRRIIDYDQKMNSEFTANMRKIIERNTPWGLNLYNGMQYTCDRGGGFIAYNGLLGFEDDMTIRQDEIIANVVTMQTDPNGKELPTRSTSIRIIKEGNNWLIDSFDVNVFLGELDYNSDNNENTTNTTNTVLDTSSSTNTANNISNNSSNTTIATDSTSNGESTSEILNKIKRYFIQVHEADAKKNPVVEVTARKYSDSYLTKEIKTTTNIFNDFLTRVNNDVIINIDNTTTYNEWCNREQKTASRSFFMMFMYDGHQTTISWDSNNENEIDMLWYNNNIQTIEIDRIRLNTSAEGILDEIINLYVNSSNENSNSSNQNVSNEKIDNYASSMSWKDYSAPGISFQYPRIFNLEEEGGYYRGNRQGEISTRINGMAVGKNPETQERIDSSLIIYVYEPVIAKVNINDYKYGENGAEKVKFVTSRGIEWFSDTVEGKEFPYVDRYTHVEQLGDGNSAVYKIEFHTNNRDNFKITNIENWLLGSTRLTSY